MLYKSEKPSYIWRFSREPMPRGVVDDKKLVMYQPSNVSRHTVIAIIHSVGIS